MDRYTRDLEEIDRSQIAIAGGKAANLGELLRIDGVSVPPGFVVTTAAFGHGAELEAEIAERVDAHAAYAVRSSATMEDALNASFAGQHDTYLDVVGVAEIARHVERCWASLASERAVAYRASHGLDERKARMAVVVQKMVRAEVSGVMFTADPITSNRNVAVVEAAPGLGEDFVSGRVNASRTKVRAGAIVERSLAPALTDEQVLRLALLGRRIEAHFGRPQDIEWCLADDRFHIVQSRPITTLFPIPAAADAGNHVYVSVGHQQMMTDAMKPLGLSLFLLTTRAPMVTAGGRLFVDVTPRLASPTSRAAVLDTLGRSDPLIRDALETVVERGFVPERPDEAPAPAPPALPELDPSIVDELIARTETSIAATKRAIQGLSGAALIDFILADIQELRRLMADPDSYRAIMAGMEPLWLLNERLEAWLGEKNAADVLTQSVPHNVTSEMGLALLDVADAIRPYAELVAWLERARDDGFVAGMRARWPTAHAVLAAWLERYGMRGVGEIDITRPRWSERPSTLLPMILRNVASFAPGEAARRFERGRAEAAQKEQELLLRLRELPDGEQRAGETKRRIDRVRAFAGYREYPKYGIVTRYYVYKQALVAEAARLVHAGVIREEEDIFYLSFEELRDVVRTRRVDPQLLADRKDAFASYRTLLPPRVLTSEGECVAGSYRRDVPAGALIGLPVSAGTVEGRARVIFDVAAADLEPGDILVTPFTDPSWTPLFVAIKGLVTEVGGLMTHGAVIAREYGLPAIVGVEGATRLINDRQRIRVHGTDGYVELLS